MRVRVRVRVDEVLAVGHSHHQNVVQRVDAIEQREQL